MHQQKAIRMLLISRLHAVHSSGPTILVDSVSRHAIVTSTLVDDFGACGRQGWRGWQASSQLMDSSMA